MQAEDGISTEKHHGKVKKKGQSLYGDKENDNITLMHDLYAVAWKMKNKGKLIDKTVGHLPKELTQAAWFFLEQGVKTSGNVFEEKYRPSLIPAVRLEIMLQSMNWSLRKWVFGSGGWTKHNIGF